jgi:hypothetical protein
MNADIRTLIKALVNLRASAFIRGCTLFASGGKTEPGAV